MDKSDKEMLVDTGKRLNSVSKENFPKLQLHRYELRIAKLAKRSIQEKGALFEAKRLKQEISLFLSRFGSKDLIGKASALQKKIDDFLSGSDITEMDTDKAEPFEIQHYLAPYRGPNTAGLKSETTAYRCNGINLTDPDPNGEALTATDYNTRRTPELESLANNFDSLEDLFKYVRDQVKPWPHFGATQSAPQVAKSKVGTFIDKSTLLISLLRSRGVAAQYVFGDVLVSESKLKGIFGVEGKFDLYWALSSNLYEYWQRPEKGAIYYRNGERTWLIPHAWVRAYIGGEWKILDPSDIYYEYGTQSPVFRKFNLDLDFEGYLIGQNQRGQYEKPGTIADYVLETAGNQIRNSFGSGLGLRDLDLTSFGRSVTPEVNGVPYGTMAYDGGGCPFHQENLIPDQFIQKFSLKMNKGGIQVFESEWELPEFFEKGLVTRHDAGLLGRVGDQPGHMKVYLGDDEAGSISARTTERINLDYYLEYHPSAYKSLRKLGDSKKSITSAGDVYAFMSYNAPVAKSNLEEEVTRLKDSISSNVDESIIYGRFLRVANILTVLQEYESNKLSKIINTVGGNIRGVFYTYGRGGIVKDRNDRPYGAVPLGTGINWIGGGQTYSRTGNFSRYGDYNNITDSRLLDIIIGSHIEANIWEILYGVPGGSSTKLMHLMAKDIFEGDKENFLVTNQQLGVGNDAEIFAKFNDDMVDFVVSRANDEDQGYIKYKSLLYSHKHAYRRDNGYVGRSMLILPTDPRVGTLALYNGAAPPSGGVGPMGGGTVANEVDGMEPSNEYDRNDPDLAGASYSCNPVSHSTGDMFHSFTDFVVKGRTVESSIRFQRKYSTSPFKPLGDLGSDWTHNFQTRVITQGFNDFRPEVQGNLIWIKEGGNKVVFTRNSDGTYEAPEGIYDELVEYTDRVEVRRKGGNYYTYAKGDASIPDGRLHFFEEVHGERITASYSNGRLESVEAPFAGRVLFNYDSQDRLTSVYRERDQLTYSYTYNANGYLASSADFDENTTRYEYVSDRAGTKAQNLLNKIIDPLDQEIAFEYYDDGRVYQEIGKGGAKSTYFYSYFLVDHLTRVRGENGATRIYKFDDEFRLIETEYQDGSRIKQVWDEDANMTAAIDELGYKTEFIYDERGNRIGVKAPEHSDFIRTEYDPVFDKPTRTIPLLGATTINTFDENTGDLLKTEKVDSLGSVFLEFTKDQFGNTLTTTNNQTSYTDTRDADGFLTQKFDLRNPVSMEYDSRGRVIQRTFANGRILTMEYDDFDRVTKISSNSGPDILNEYDVLGQLISRTVSDGVTSKTTRYEYDSRGRQVAVIDPLGRRTEKKYDIPGLGCKYVIDKPVEIVDPNGRETHFEFDSRNRLIRSVAPDGTVTRREYNERGDLIAITDGSGNRSTFRYDGNRRLIKKMRPSSRSSINGEPEAAKEVTHLIYDEADRLIREEKLLPGTTNGTETAKLVTEYSYSELGQVVKKIVKKEFMGQSKILDEATFSYQRLLDAPSQLTANNQHVNLGFSHENKPPFAMTDYSVHSAKTNNPLGIIEGDFSVENDPSGGLKTLREANLNNPIFENEFDREGRLTKKTSRYNGHRLISTQEYDSYGRKMSIAHDTGLEGEMSYDKLNRLKSLNYFGEGYEFSEFLTYELSTGNLTRIERELGDLDLTYDSKDQLQSVSYSGDQGLESVLNRTLTYDRSGNRLDDTFSGQGRFIRNAVVEDENFRYYSDSNGFGNIVQRTNKTTGEQQVYDYWTDGKMRKLTKYEQLPNSTTTMEVDYYFDALGRRVAKKIKTRSNEFTNTYTYLANQDKILLAKSGDNKVQLQVDGQGIDEHWAQINKSGIKTFTSDHLGTVINSEVTNDSKITGAFGEALQATPELNLTTNPLIYGYTGRQFEPETGLYFYRNRVYDQNSGRFLTKDPKGFAAGDVNLYRYVKNSPTNSIDPFGLDGDILSLSASFQFGTVGFEAQVGYARTRSDSGKDESGIIGSIAFKSGPGIEANVGAEFTYSPDAQRLDDFSGIFAGGQANLLAGGVEASASVSSDNRIIRSFSVSGSAGAGIGSATLDIGKAGVLLQCQ